VLGCGFFSCISGSDAAGAAAVGRITIDAPHRQRLSAPYACALVASGACTGILIPPSIAYIIIGLVLGISTSTLFLAASIPGVMIMASIMITNAVMNRLHGYENSRERFSFRHWLATVWDAALRPDDPVHHPRRHLFGHLHADRGRRRRGGHHDLHGPAAGHPDAPSFPKHAGKLGQGERRHRADHRGGPAAGPGAGHHGGAADLHSVRHRPDRGPAPSSFC
jgi:hypothetical protein